MRLEEAIQGSVSVARYQVYEIEIDLRQSCRLNIGETDSNGSRENLKKFTSFLKIVIIWPAKSFTRRCSFGGFTRDVTKSGRI